MAVGTSEQLRAHGYRPWALRISAALPPGAVLSLHCLEAPHSCARQHHANSRRVLNQCLPAGAHHINSCSRWGLSPCHHRAAVSWWPTAAASRHSHRARLPAQHTARRTAGICHCGQPTALLQPEGNTLIKCTCLQELGPLEGSPPMLDQAQAPASRNGLHVPRRGLWQVPHWGDWSCWSCARSTRSACMLAPECVCAWAGCFQGSMHVLVSRITPGC